MYYFQNLCLPFSETKLNNAEKRGVEAIYVIRGICEYEFNSTNITHI